MKSTRRWVFSFRYVRRGQTNLWDQDRGRRDEYTAEMPWQGPGVRLAGLNEKLEWIEVAVELPGDQDLDEAQDQASDQADAEFRSRHLGADLALGD